MRCFCTRATPTVLVLGLPGSGKSTILSYIKNKASKEVSPTKNSEFSRVNYKGHKIKFLEIPGNRTDIWLQFSRPSKAIMFVFDFQHKESLQEFSTLVVNIMSDKSNRNKNGIIFINSADQNTVKTDEMTNLLQNLNLESNIKILPCDGKQGTAVLEGYEWLMNRVLDHY